MLFISHFLGALRLPSKCKKKRKNTRISVSQDYAFYLGRYGGGALVRLRKKNYETPRHRLFTLPHPGVVRMPSNAKKKKLLEMFLLKFKPSYACIPQTWSKGRWQGQCTCSQRQILEKVRASQCALSPHGLWFHWNRFQRRHFSFPLLTVFVGTGHALLHFFSHPFLSAVKVEALVDHLPSVP